MSLTESAHKLVKRHFSDPEIPRDLAIDATCGNGTDTEFLAQMGFKQVVGFDIQERAATITRARLKNAGLNNVGLILDGHETIGRHIASEIDCVMFNLGYLPQGDKNITTHKTSSLVALSYATRLLSRTGIISLLCYPGHRQGKEETRAIQKWLEALGSDWKIRAKASKNPTEDTPILYSITRKPKPVKSDDEQAT